MANLQAKQNWAIENVKSFVKFYQSQETNVSTTFRVFDHGDFYSTHGKNAILAAKHVFNTPTAICHIKAQGTEIETVYLGKLNFESLARDLLLVLQYRLQIYALGQNNEWSIAYKASPGNLIEVEELLFTNVDLSNNSSAMLSVRYHNNGGQILVNLGYVDTTLCEMKYAQFNDNSHFSALESAIIQLGAKECITPKLDSSAESTKLMDVVKRSNILLTEQPRDRFSTKNFPQDLQRLVKKPKGQEDQILSSAHTWTGDYPEAASCLASLVHYLDMMNKEDGFGQYVVNKYDLAHFVRLGSTALHALNLFPEPGSYSTAQSNRSVNSLFGLLNHCQTLQGQRMLSRWIKQPLIDINHIEERLTAVEAFTECAEMRMTLSDQHLKKLPDFDKFSKKFLRKKASLQDCYRVYQGLKVLPFVCECIEEHSLSLDQNGNLLKEVFMTPIHELLIDFRKYTDMIDTTLDFDMIEKHEFMVKPDFDPELQRLRDKMDAVESSMASALTKAASELDLDAGKTIKLESTSQFGHVFRITCKEEKKLRNNKKFTHLDTSKAAVRFTNNRLRGLSEDLQDHKRAYQLQQDAVVKEIVAIAAGYVEPMQVLGDLIAKLDVLVSFAQASVMAPMPYVRPKLHAMGSSNNRLKLVQSRHPCIERQDSVSFIPNDALLESNDHNFIIVTGPNMGGKSTFIRQVGVVVLMAQIGCFVPCDEAELCLFDAILARIGAGDCQVQGVSTFMAEMLETASILRSATDNSLLIIDELGRGTSTYDGFGLAWAISHNIAVDMKSSCLFATHFHEMTSLADEVQSAVNYHVTAMTGTGENGRSNLTMLYQVKRGSCDRSFGIHVAECVGFPRCVIDAAKQKADELEQYFVTMAPEDEGDALSAEEESRKKRKLKQEGDEMIDEFLNAVQAVDWQALDESEAKLRMKALKSPILASDNSYLKKLIEKIESGDSE
uniref:DNA mismatch repair protein MSH2 n=1 Tax=Phallusia mammillata TaxID=59560 RepID=A0A6F9DM14_9ASCI|nr:DNA mismatch repair protein Msh2 [Phallusia mammillata]